MSGYSLFLCYCIAYKYTIFIVYYYYYYLTLVDTSGTIIITIIIIVRWYNIVFNSWAQPIMYFWDLAHYQYK